MVLPSNSFGFLLDAFDHDYFVHEFCSSCFQSSPSRDDLDLFVDRVDSGHWFFGCHFPKETLGVGERVPRAVANEWGFDAFASDQFVLVACRHRNLCWPIAFEEANVS